MASSDVINTQHAWRVWIGNKMSIRIETEEDAARYLCQHGDEFTGQNGSQYGVANAIREVLSSDPLPDGETFHRVIYDALMMVVYKGQARKVLPRVVPSRLKRMDSEWVKRYKEADDDDQVLLIKPGSTLLEQLEARWPSPKA